LTVYKIYIDIDILLLYIYIYIYIYIHIYIYIYIYILCIRVTTFDSVVLVHRKKNSTSTSTQHGRVQVQVYILCICIYICIYRPAAPCWSSGVLQTPHGTACGLEQALHTQLHDRPIDHHHLILSDTICLDLDLLDPLTRYISISYITSTHMHGTDQLRGEASKQ